MKKSNMFLKVLVISVVCIGTAVVTLIIDNNFDSKKESNVVETIATTPTVIETAIQTTATPRPTFTPGPFEVQNSYGFYRDCDDTQCIDYNFEITMTRDNCNNYLCSTKIEFTSEYGDGSMWIDYFDVQISKKVHSGDVIELPSLDSTSWDIGPRSFFDLTVTPQS